MPRFHLPVLVDRRVVLRGMALTLLGSLTGCANDSRDDDGFGDGDGTANTGGGSTGDGSTGGTTGGGTTGGGTTGGGTTTTGFERCGTELCLDLSDPANATLRGVDGARVILFEGKRMLIIHIEQGRFLALSAVCTHNGCTVRYAPATTDIGCPCHGSTFALDGAVTNGPADSPLATYAATYDASTQVVRVMLG